MADLDAPPPPGAFGPPPVTDDWLALYSDAIEVHVTEVLEDGTHVYSGDGKTLDAVLDLAAGHDPTDVTVDADNPRFVTVNHPLYHPNNLTAALIDEVRRLRAMLDGLGVHPHASGRECPF